MSQPVFIVMLRRPGKGDERADPFWEFGSFGCTGCHSKNLLHWKNCQIRDGDRLAFVQGGDCGARLVLVTPPITRIDHGVDDENGIVELRWDATALPFKYRHAPPLFDLHSPRETPLFPLLADSIRDTNRPSPDAKLSSRFRARTRPLKPELARELVAGYDRAMKKAHPIQFVTRYEEALPWCDCPTPPDGRKLDYQRKLRVLKNTPPTAAGKKRC